MRYFIIILTLILSGCYVSKDYDTYYYDEVYYPLRGNHSELVIPSGNIFSGWSLNSVYNNQNNMRWCYQCNVHYYGFYHIHNNCCDVSNSPIIVAPNNITNTQRPSLYNNQNNNQGVNPRPNTPRPGNDRPSVPSKPKIPTTPRSPR